jgi:hypothetical protein
MYAGNSPLPAFHPADQSLYPNKRRNSNHPCPRIDLFKPDFSLTFLPGSSIVPQAEVFMPRMFSVLVMERLKYHLERVCEDFGCRLVDANGERDHVHQLV